MGFVMTYSIYATEAFEKELDKLSSSDVDIVKKMFLQLKENPFVGDAIRYRFFREKRVREKRVYYLVYEDLSSVLLVAIGGKKAQSDTIDEIVRLLPEFKVYMKKLLEDG